MDEQPPQPPGDTETGERFPRFDPEFAGERPLPLQRARGARPYRGGGQPNPWLVGLAVLIVLAAVSIIAFGLLAKEDDTGTAGSTSTTVADSGSSTTSGSTGTDGTTVTTNGTTGTTGGGSTSTGGSTATTTGTTISIGNGGTPTITPVGDPIPIAELTMSSNDIGPLDFGDDGDDVLGRLAATFGEPMSDTGFIVGNGGFGECPGDSIRVVQWGPLNAVIRGETANSQFVSYRIDLRFGGITSLTTDIQTLSGLRVGDTVGQLTSTYSGFVVEFVVDPTLGMTFELRSTRDGPLLLWGPIESADDNALVTGVYSPDSCTA